MIDEKRLIRGTVWQNNIRGYCEVVGFSERVAEYWIRNPYSETGSCMETQTIHHINTRGAHGLDECDDNLLALTYEEHEEWHRGGPIQFIEHYPATSEKVLSQKPKLEAIR